MLRRTLCIALITPVLWACTGEVGSGSGGGGPSFAHPPVQSNYTFVTNTPGASGHRIEIQHAGAVDRGGRSWQQYTLTGGADPSMNASALVNLSSEGVEYTEARIATSDTVGEAIADPPLELVLTAPVGQEQEFSTNVSLSTGQPGNPGSPSDIPVSGSYVLVSNDAVVQTALGEVAGLSHYRGGAMLLGSQATVNVWVAPHRGPVAFDYDWPSLPGLQQSGGASLGGFSSRVDHPNGTRTLYAETVLGPESEGLRVDTYDVAGELDADKTVHAKMIVAARWADGERARTDEVPPVYERFGTTMGSFPSYMSDVQASPLHPAESGEGYVWWVAFVDQAAKNEPGDGTSFHAQVHYDPNYGAADGAPVRVAASITYKPLR